MPRGTVSYYNRGRGFGFLEPERPGRRNIYFRVEKRDPLHDAGIREPRLGDEVIYEASNYDSAVVASWFLPTAAGRVPLTEDQRELMGRVLGSSALDWEIWATRDDQPENQTEQREWCGGRFNGGGPLNGYTVHGTFGQVLLAARYAMAKSGQLRAPLVRWPDMPQYSVRFQADGTWNPAMPAWYTECQARAFAQHLRSHGGFATTVVYNLWPDAPRLSTEGAARVLAECRRLVYQEGRLGEPEVGWYDDRWGQPVRVATGCFSQDSPAVDLDGQQYWGQDALGLQFCGRPLALDH